LEIRSNLIKRTGLSQRRLAKLSSVDKITVTDRESVNLIQTLLENDLVDEPWLKIFPLTLDNGEKLYQFTVFSIFPLFCEGNLDTRLLNPKNFLSTLSAGNFSNTIAAFFKIIIY